MDATAHRHINTSSDSELLLNIFADNLQETGKFRINEEDIFTAIGGLMKQCKGAYACVAMLAGFGIIAFRDPNGIRPLGLAHRQVGVDAYDWLFSSESVVADASGFVGWEDVKPGMNQPPHMYLLTDSLLQVKPSLLRELAFHEDKLARRQHSPPTFSSSYTLPVPTLLSMVLVYTEVGWPWGMLSLTKYRGY